MVGVVLVVLGAAVMGASAATSSFDLGEDLELGKAVHDVEQGPLMAWFGAVVLLAVAVMAVVRPVSAARVLVWLSVGAAVGSVIFVSMFSVVDGSIVGLDAVPFVIAFFSVPAFIASLLLKAPNDAT